MNIIQNLKDYFKNKETNNAAVAPMGVCPNCFGKQAWDGEYYKFMKGENENPSEERYNSFVQDVARKLDTITVKGNAYSCETCSAVYDKK